MEAEKEMESAPKSDRPRMFGTQADSEAKLPWTWAVTRLIEARNYWIATTRPDGRPHSRPVWGVWLNGAFYFSTGSLALQNLATRPAITVHLESGDEAVILEGEAEPVKEMSLIEQVVNIYNQKYQWDMDPHSLPGPFYAVRPQLAFGWLSDGTGQDKGAAFSESTTRWRFS